jgi:uncharacterized protein (TIGR02145 family)
MAAVNRQFGTRFLASALLASAVLFVYASGCANNGKPLAAETADSVAATAEAGILAESEDSAGKLSMAFTDPRDGQRYRAVKIGNDIWMAQNLNYKTLYSKKSWCSGNDYSQCAAFGRLYDWDSAQTACPAGWHLSTDEEWIGLMTAAGGKRASNDKRDDPNWNRWVGADKKLKAKSGWGNYNGKKGNGTDDYGFSALPGGQRYGGGEFKEPGEYSVWWTTKENNYTSAYRMEMLGGYSFIGTAFKEQGFSVRCVNDDGVYVRAGERDAFFSFTLLAGDGGRASASPRKEFYAAGETVTLTAFPDSEYEFAGWTGGRAADSAKAVTAVVVMSDTTVAANFRRIDYGSLADGRYGKTYSTAVIGGKRWMAENLNIKTDGSWCYDNDESNCDKYGRLYNCKAAKAACPAGWHLPSREEWGSLAKAAGGRGKYGTAGKAGKKLKSTSGWNNKGNGTDDYVFSALPGGLRRASDGDFDNAGNYGYWWTAMEGFDGYAYHRGMIYNYDYVNEDNYGADYGFSVRCVGDD